MDGFAFWAIALLIAGLVMLVIEIFVPTGGTLGVITAFLFIASIVCAWNAWWPSHPVIWWSYLVVLIAMIPGTIVGAFTVLPHTSTGKRIILEAPEQEAVTPFVAESARLVRLIGKRGVAVTPLIPGGIVSVMNQRVDAVSDGLTVEARQIVEVIAVRGTRLVVRLCLDDGPADQPAEAPPASDSPNASKIPGPWITEGFDQPPTSPPTTPSRPLAKSDRLDFDIPDE